jgi:hypothetical protein
MAACSLSHLKGEFLTLRQHPCPPITTLDALYISIPHLTNYLTRQNERVARSYHIIYSPTYLGLEKLLQMQGIEAGAEINFRSLMDRLQTEKSGAFVTDKGVLIESELEYQAVGLCFQRLADFLLVFIYDANPSQEALYEGFQKKLQESVSTKVVILTNKCPVLAADFQKKVQCSLAMRAMTMFKHHPNFFGELLSINGLSHEEIQPLHPVERLPREMEAYDAETARVEHHEHVKNLFLLFEQDTVTSPSMFNSMVTRFAGFFFGEGVKKND